MYDIRGADGTGTSANPVLSKTTNAKAYTVHKLADGNCWMTQNLTLPLTAGVTVEAASNTSATPISFTPTSCSSNGNCPLNGNTKAGNGTYYYSWFASTAGTVTGSTPGGEDASGSICPVGWRLPPNYTISTTKSYGALTNAYGFTTNGENNSQNHVSELESFPLNFARLGYYYLASLYSNAIYGGAYISSTAASSTYYEFMYAYQTVNYTHPQAYPTTTRGNNGMNIRCVAL